MSDVLAYAIAALLLVQALLRVPAALKGRGRKRSRSLWGAFAALAAAWLTRTTAVRTLLNDLGVPDLAYLVKHVLVILGICVLLRYITAVYSATDASAKVPRSVRISGTVHRIATRASVGTVIVMTTVYFTLLGDPVADVPYFVGRHAGQPGLALYMGLFYLYCASAAAVCAVQWGGAAKQMPLRSVRIGLTMMAFAMILGVVYALLRIAYVVLVTVTPVSEAFSLDQEAVTDTLLYLTFLLWGLGAIAPVVRAASTNYRAVKDLAALHPLWRDLALAAPHKVRHRPSTILGNVALTRLNKMRDLFSRYDDSPSSRLGRYVAEIRDIILELRRHAPQGLADWALLRAAGPEQSGANAAVAAEALWLRAARVAYHHRPEGALAPFPFASGQSMGAEVPHFRAVAAAYKRTSAADVLELFDEGSPFANAPTPS